MPQSVFDMPGFVPEVPVNRPQSVFDMTAGAVVSDGSAEVEEVPQVAPKSRSSKPAGQSAEATEEGK